MMAGNPGPSGGIENNYIAIVRFGKFERAPRDLKDIGFAFANKSGQLHLLPKFFELLHVGVAKPLRPQAAKVFEDGFGEGLSDADLKVVVFQKESAGFLILAVEDAAQGKHRLEFDPGWVRFQTLVGGLDGRLGLAIEELEGSEGDVRLHKAGLVKVVGGCGV